MVLRIYIIYKKITSISKQFKARLFLLAEEKNRILTMNERLWIVPFSMAYEKRDIIVIESVQKKQINGNKEQMS